jgi:hypothetical protein
MKSRNARNVKTPIEDRRKTVVQIEPAE